MNVHPPFILDREFDKRKRKLMLSWERRGDTDCLVVSMHYVPGDYDDHIYWHEEAPLDITLIHPRDIKDNKPVSVDGPAILHCRKPSGTDEATPDPYAKVVMLSAPALLHDYVYRDSDKREYLKLRVSLSQSAYMQTGILRNNPAMLLQLSAMVRPFSRVSPRRFHLLADTGFILNSDIHTGHYGGSSFFRIGEEVWELFLYHFPGEEYEGAAPGRPAVIIKLVSASYYNRLKTIRFYFQNPEMPLCSDVGDINIEAKAQRDKGYDGLKRGFGPGITIPENMYSYLQNEYFIIGMAINEGCSDSHMPEIVALLGYSPKTGLVANLVDRLQAEMFKTSKLQNDLEQLTSVFQTCESKAQQFDATIRRIGIVEDKQRFKDVYALGRKFSTLEHYPSGYQVGELKKQNENRWIWCLPDVGVALGYTFSDRLFISPSFKYDKSTFQIVVKFPKDNTNCIAGLYLRAKPKGSSFGRKNITKNRMLERFSFTVLNDKCQPQEDRKVTLEIPDNNVWSQLTAEGIGTDQLLKFGDAVFFSESLLIQIEFEPVPPVPSRRRSGFFQKRRSTAEILPLISTGETEQGDR